MLEMLIADDTFHERSYKVSLINMEIICVSRRDDISRVTTEKIAPATKFYSSIYYLKRAWSK